MEKSVVVDKLIKNFEVTQKEKGFLGSISTLYSPKKKTVRALKEISFSVDEGELIGFIGPNGAGKTTTLKILSGLLYPTRGFTQVLGHDPWERKPEFLKKISIVMGQKNQLWWDLPAMETFELNKEIYQIPDNKYKENLEELVKLLEVKKILDIQVRRLSLGQRMRLELVAALLHGPKVLFLDEPTIGLDIVGQQKVRDFIKDYNRRNKATILLTSHNIGDVKDLTKRVVVISKGVIIFDGELDELVRNFAKHKTIELFLSKDIDVKTMEKVGEIKNFNFPKVEIAVPKETAAFAAAELLQNYPVADLIIQEESMEEIIRRIFKGELLVEKTIKKK